MTIEALLGLRQSVFEQIDEAVKEKDFVRAYALLDSPQPQEWQRFGKSVFSDETYLYNEVNLIEALMRRVFGRYQISHIFNPPVITGSGDGFAITIQLNVKYTNWEDGNNSNYLPGIATVYSPNIEQLTVATPTAVSEAFKNACKRIGTFFGRDLNRRGQDISVIPVKKEPDIYQNEFYDLLSILIEKSQDEAESILRQSTFKYNPALKKLVSILNKNV